MNDVEAMNKYYITLEEKRMKRREVKRKLIEQVVDMLQGDVYNYEEFTYDLVREALWRRTNKEMKEML